MPIAYNAGTRTLTLTGGTSAARLTPLNVVSDATAFSTSATYAVGAIVKHDVGGGLGTALYACTTAVTVAGAFTPANWTLLCHTQGLRTIYLNAFLGIGAFYNDTAWQYNCVWGIPITAAGCNWVSGLKTNDLDGAGFSIIYNGDGIANGGTNMLPNAGSTDSITWGRVRVTSISTNPNRGIWLENSSIKGSIAEFTMDQGAMAGGNNRVICRNVSIGKFIAIKTLMTVDPAAITEFVMTGDWGGPPHTKINIANPGQSNPLRNFAPGLPADLSKILGILAGANQYFQDTVLPTGFDYSTMVQAYHAGMSAFFTRSVDLVCKQGSALLAGVSIRGRNDINGTEAFAGVSNASGAFSAKTLIYSGNRTSGGSYTLLENQVYTKDKTVLFRRADLIDAVYTQDMNTQAMSLTQFMQADAYYTANQSALVGIAADAATKTITISAALTLDQIYDWMKWWLAQSAQMASVLTTPLSPSGTVLTLLNGWSLDVAAGGAVNAGTKLKSLVETGTVTVALGGSMNIDYTDALGSRVTIKERTGKPLTTYVVVNGVPVGGTTVDGAFRPGFVPLALTRTLTVQPTDQVRISASYYGSKPTVFNLLGSQVSEFTLTLEAEPAFDTTISTIKRDAITAALDTVVNALQVELTVNRDLSEFTPSEVLNGFSYYIASRGHVIAASIVAANSASFYAISTGTLTVYTPDFKVRLADLDATGAAIVPTAAGYLIPLVLQYINPMTGAKAPVTILNASSALLGTAAWPQSQASLGDADQASIAARTKAAIEASAVLAKEATLTAAVTTLAAEHDATQAAIAALPTASSTASAVRTELATELGRIDAAVSTRLATSGYAAPASASDIAAAVETAILTEGDGRQVLQAIADKIGNENVSAATVAAQVRTALAPELARLDVAVSTRAAAGAEVPANVVRINGVQLQGTGSAGDSFRPKAG